MKESFFFFLTFSREAPISLGLASYAAGFFVLTKPVRLRGRDITSGWWHHSIHDFRTVSPLWTRITGPGKLPFTVNMLFVLHSLVKLLSFSYNTWQKTIKSLLLYISVLIKPIRKYSQQIRSNGCSPKNTKKVFLLFLIFKIFSFSSIKNVKNTF